MNLQCSPRGTAEAILLCSEAPIYTKYELAYPCGNDANTGRCCRYNSILSLKKKIVWLHPLVPHWYKRMKPRENRIRKFIFSGEYIKSRMRPNAKRFGTGSVSARS